MYVCIYIYIHIRDRPPGCWHYIFRMVKESRSFETDSFATKKHPGWWIDPTYKKQMGVSKNRVPRNGWFMIGNLKWMIWGYHYFWKHQNMNNKKTWLLKNSSQLPWLSPSRTRYFPAMSTLPKWWISLWKLSLRWMLLQQHRSIEQRTTVGRWSNRPPLLEKLLAVSVAICWKSGINKQGQI